ncbi:MAG: hypothetical protein QOF49_692 [Chloroflexota bacterium]|jgi:hypothetical protein|nr:hypothetical protein [Chloroflexota bacterium]
MEPTAQPEDDGENLILRQVLAPDERVRVKAIASDAVLAVTDRRLVVAAPSRLALAIEFAAVRRVQFDIERDRPATLVIVPELASDEPQVLAIAPHQYEAAAAAIVALGLALDATEPVG